MGARVARIVADTGSSALPWAILARLFCGGRKDGDEVGSLGGGNVIDAQLRLGVEHARDDRPVCNRGESERGQEFEGR